MTAPDPTADAFMRGILADPTDPLPRLVFADWLEETGTSSNLAWARFLRLAEDLAALPETDPRRRKVAAQLERVGRCVRAKLTYRAEVLVAHPGPMLRLLPARCQELNLSTVYVPEAVFELFPESVAREHLLFPLAMADGALVVAASLHSGLTTSAPTLEYMLNRPVVTVRGPADHIIEAINRHYGTVEVLSIDSQPPTWPEPMVETAPQRVWHLLTADEADPILRHVHRVLATAIRAGVSAVEFGWDGRRVALCHHIGGVRVEQAPLPLPWYLLAVHHLRVMAGLAVAPQDADQAGTARCLLDGVEWELGVRITGDVSSPRVVVTIPPATDAPPAALNPAA